MSVHRAKTKKRAWEVRYRDEVGRQKSVTIEGSKEDANQLDRHIKSLRRRGVVDQLNAGSETLAEFVEQWWRAHALTELRESTRANYKHVWDLHVLPYLGHYQLRELSPRVVEQELKVPLAEAGVGRPTIYRAMAVLQSVCALAVRWDKIGGNPVNAVPKPSQRRKQEVRPPSPLTVERIRQQLGQRDRVIVSVLAYAGLRPGELRRLKWANVRKRTLLIEGETKTDKSRTVRLLAPLAGDLAAWRLANGNPGRGYVFPTERAKKGEPGNGQWTPQGWRNWQRKEYRDVAGKAGAGPRAYDLRHTFVSLLIHEGLSVVEVARQAGHSTATCWDHYAHVFEEFDPAERVSAEDAIRRARRQLAKGKAAA